METYGDVVDPDQVGVVDGDGITTPDVLRVEVGDGNVPVEISLGTSLEADLSCTHWMMTLEVPLTMRRPLPMITPLLPSPMMVLSLATVMPSIPAASLKRRSEMFEKEAQVETYYLTETVGALDW